MISDKAPLLFVGVADRLGVHHLKLSYPKSGCLLRQHFHFPVCQLAARNPKEVKQNKEPSRMGDLETAKPMFNGIVGVEHLK